MTDVDPEEAEAVREAVSAGSEAQAEVQQRDFRRPLRLSRGVRAEIQRAVDRALADAGERVTLCLTRPASLELASLAEGNADELFGEAAELLSVLRFRLGGQTAWLAWEPANALAAVDSLLGGGEPKGLPEPRLLSPLEGRVLGSLLGEILTPLAPALGAPATDACLVQEAAALGSWRDDGEVADAYRMTLELVLTLGEESSTLLLHVPYLPQAFEEGAQLDADEEAALPTHLERVEVEVLASFDGGEFSLSQLLALEEGDVLPIDARIGDPVVASVDGKPMAQASLGAQNGQKAVRIDGFEVDKGLAE